MAPPDILLQHDFLGDHAALLDTLRNTVPWDSSMSSRQTASYGAAYNYSQMVYPSVPMHPALVPVAELLKQRLGIAFNNCLLNLYPSGESTMGFHTDDTAGLVPGTGVAIVSLGTAREITFRSIDNPDQRHAFLLQPGSLLYMDDAIQTAWKHAVKKSPAGGPRISLTWRAVDHLTAS